MSAAIFPAAKKTLLQLLGPSIVLVAMSLSGGELLLWPHLVANYGFNILWPIPIILILQFAVNIEIERYTLVTGKSTEESIAGHSMWLSIVFALTVLLALVWPAWITTSGNLLALLLWPGHPNFGTLGVVISIVLLCLGLLIFWGKQSYRILEMLSKVGLVMALIIIMAVVIIKFDAHAFMQALQGFAHWGYVPKSIERFAFVGALAYGGVAGVLNLVQSEWIKEKGYGVNQMKTAVSTELESSQSKLNYRTWFRLINQEHFFIFVVANLFSIFLLAYLGYLLLPLGSAQGFGVITKEITSLNNFVPLLGNIFAIAAILIFFMANMTILDSIGRLTYRLIKPIKAFRNINGRSISIFAIVLGIFILMMSLVFPNFKQPFFLLVTSAYLSAFSMALYPPLLLRLNYQLPQVARPSWWRTILVIAATLFYGFVSLWAISSYVSFWIIAGIALVVGGYHVYVLLTIRRTHHG